MESNVTLVWYALPVIAFIAFAILIPLLFRKVVPTNEVHIVQTSKKTIPYGKDEATGND